MAGLAFLDQATIDDCDQPVVGHRQGWARFYRWEKAAPDRQGKGEHVIGHQGRGGHGPCLHRRRLVRARFCRRGKGVNGRLELAKIER
jgi:hypothetical protein